MSTPQLEDGFVRIANKLLEAILGGGFSHREQSVIITIIRKTYGYGKKEDDMSAAQIGTMCNVARQHVTSTLNALAARNVITKRQGKYGMIVGIQKDHRKWITAGQMKAVPGGEQDEEDSPKSGLVPKQDASQIGTGDSPESGQVDSPKSGHTKDNLPKENHQKTNSCAPQADHDQGDGASAGTKAKARPSLAGELAARFERFYDAYPRKRARGAAEKAFAKLAPDDATVDLMVAAVARLQQAGEWTNPKFIPHPASWLNATGWLDQVQTEYSPAEADVIAIFNELLGDQMGCVSATMFDPARAALIREFLTFNDKPDLARRFFTWFGKTSEAPPRAGFNWLISRRVYGDAIDGAYTRQTV
jgi:phage replication O-like protein O